jgi:aldehyde:ferredoxin oxidoreductase
VDTAGLCLFVAFALLDDPKAIEAVCEMLAATYGRTFGAEEFVALGKKVLAAERQFNAAAGFGPGDDRLPPFFKTEKLAPHQVTFAVPDEELDTVFDFVP